jgi:hypothetical protein
MHLANFTFNLLDTVFLCHLWGLRTKSCSNKSSQDRFRSSQVALNSKAFYTYFTRELAIRYDTDLGELINITAYNRRFKKLLAVDVRVLKPDKSSRRRYRV